MILPLEIKQFESIDTQNFLAREARRNFVTSLGPKAPKNLPNLVKSHEHFVWDKNLSKSVEFRVLNPPSINPPPT